MNEDLIAVLYLSAEVIAGMMLLVWLVSLWKTDASIVDLVWGVGFVVVGWTVFLSSGGPEYRRWLLPVLVTIWGVRLSGYLLWRNYGQPEDFRYRSMRQKWGRFFPLASLLIVFALQGVVMWVVSLPVQLGIPDSEDNVAWLQFTGLCLWVIGLCFESVGDWQLARFKSDPQNQGRVLDTGLWRYTRHPNYFGDFLVWWGLYVIAMGEGAPWWTAIGPLVMSVFLLRISGITLLERTLNTSKPGYASYVERTNAFFPAPPKK